MRKRFTLTKEQQEELRACPYVSKVSARMVQYTADFKKHAISERAFGKPPRVIFAEADIPYHFDPGYAADRIRAWRRIATRGGVSHFDVEMRGREGTVALLRRRDTQRTYKKMTDTEKIRYLEARAEALEHVARHFGLPPSLHRAHSSRRRQK